MYRIFCLLLLSPPLLCAQEMFQLAPPIMGYSSVFFAEKATITLQFAQNNTQIRYTLDQSDPTEQSPLYTAPIAVTSSGTTVKARVFGAGFLPSDVTAATFFALGKKVHHVTHTPPAAQYPGTGPRTLVDAVGGNTDYRNPGWLGFNQDSLVVVMDFEKKAKVRSVLLDFLQSEGSWIFLPGSVTVEGWDDKKRQYVALARREWRSETPAQRVQCVAEELRFSTAFRTKQLRLTIRPLAAIPEWHPGKGAKGWFFVDEIIAY